MEIINNENTKKLSKAIAQYCLRIFVFLVLRRLFISDIFLEHVHSPIISFLTKNMNSEDGLYIWFLLFILGIYIECYISAKITGIFKKLDGLNFFLALFIVFLIDILFNYFVMVQVQFIPFKIGFRKDTIIFYAPFMFLIYRFFGFLTKIFPVPFEKIGYIFSIEFVKDVIKRVKTLF